MRSTRVPVHFSSPDLGHDLEIRLYLQMLASILFPYQAGSQRSHWLVPLDAW